MKGSCARLAVITLIWLVGMTSYSYGQFLPGGQPGVNTPPNLFQVPGQPQPAPVFGGQGGPIQVPQVPQVGIPGQFPQGTNPAFGNNGFGSMSTPFGGSTSGQSTIVTGLGALELGTAQGNVLNQQATSIYLNNYKQAASTYYDVRRIHDNARAEHQRVPSTREQLDSTAKIGAPSRLTKDEFEPTSGAIAWPEVLAGAPFAEFRAQLEKLFAERANAGGGRGSDNFHAIRTATSQMQNRLQSMASSLSPQEYIAGHKFIASLAYEGGRVQYAGVALTK